MQYLPRKIQNSHSFEKSYQKHPCGTYERRKYLSYCMSKVHDFPKSKLNINGDNESCIACGKFVVNIKYHGDETQRQE